MYIYVYRPTFYIFVSTRNGRLYSPPTNVIQVSVYSFKALIVEPEVNDLHNLLTIHGFQQHNMYCNEQVRVEHQKFNRQVGYNVTILIGPSFLSNPCPCVLTQVSVQTKMKT